MTDPITRLNAALEGRYFMAVYTFHSVLPRQLPCQSNGICAM